MRYSSPGLVFIRGEALAIYAIEVSTAALTSSKPRYSVINSAVIHSNTLVFGFLQAQFLEPGHCRRDSDWHL